MSETQLSPSSCKKPRLDHEVTPLLTGGNRHYNAGKDQLTISKVSQMQEDQLIPNFPMPSVPQFVEARGSEATGHPQEPIDRHKLSLVQQQLLILLHAHKCQDSGGYNRAQGCKISHCYTMRTVLQHMTLCNKGNACDVTHCASSRHIITHWKKCLDVNCPLCSPLRRDCSHVPPLINWRPNINLSNCKRWNLNDPPTHESKGLAFLQEVSENIQTHDQLSRRALQNDEPQSNFPNTNEQNINPIPAKKVKHWHLDEDEDLRRHRIHQLIKAFLPAPAQAGIQQSGVRDWKAYAEYIVNHAKLVEKDMYESASSQIEYLHLLVGETYQAEVGPDLRRVQQFRSKRRSTQVRYSMQSQCQSVAQSSCRLHPTSIGGSDTSFSMEEILASVYDKFNCAICVEPRLEMVTGLCQHRFCTRCLYDRNNRLKKVMRRCPLCRRKRSFPMTKPTVPQDNIKLQQALGVLSCPNQGCNVEMWHWEAEKHKRECDFICRSEK